MFFNETIVMLLGRKEKNSRTCKMSELEESTGGVKSILCGWKNRGRWT